MEKKPKDVKRSICFYHLCRKRGLVHKCSYCGEFFCEKHLKATPPGPPRFTERDEEDRRFMQEWHKEGGHPCVPYLDVFKEEMRKQELEVTEALDRLKQKRMLRSPPQQIPEHDSTKFEPTEALERLKNRGILPSSQQVKEPDTEKKVNPSQPDHSPKKEPFLDRSYETKNYSKIAAIGIFVLLIIFFLWGFIIVGQGPNCMDGTVHGQCSGTKPLYCSNKTLTNRADLCGCPPNFTIRGEVCEELGKCNDSTSTGHCSQNQPLYCLNSVLSNRAELCGCSGGLIANGTACIEPPHCEDGTLYDRCSADKPLYCSEGSLVQKARTCGCHPEYVTVGETCVSRYETNPKEISLDYTLRGQKGSIDYTVYAGLNSHLASKSRSFICSPVCPSQEDMELSVLSEPHQEEHLLPLVWAIEHETDDKDDQARIAINLVQSIPYDLEGFRSGDLTGRYPYEVLYDQKGVCGEKAKLLTFLLRELGYGVVLLNYEEQLHEAVGIKCPVQYSWEHSGYCFVESTVPSIVSDDQGDYVGVGKLTTEPTVILVSDGDSFDGVSEEYSDAREFIRIRNEMDSGQIYQDWSDYSLYASLVEKYGIEIDEIQ